MKNWKKVLLNPLDSLSRTIQVLDSGGIRIALVVDSNKKLLGIEILRASKVMPKVSLTKKVPA